MASATGISNLNSLVQGEKYQHSMVYMDRLNEGPDRVWSIFIPTHELNINETGTAYKTAKRVQSISEKSAATAILHEIYSPQGMNLQGPLQNRVIQAASPSRKLEIEAAKASEQTYLTLMMQTAAETAPDRGVYSVQIPQNLIHRIEELYAQIISENISKKQEAEARSALKEIILNSGLWIN